MDPVRCADLNNRLRGVLERRDDICAVIDQLIAAGGLKACIIPASREYQVDLCFLIYRLNSKGKLIDRHDNIRDRERSDETDIVGLRIQTCKNSFQIPDVLDRTMHGREVSAVIVCQRNGIKCDIRMTFCYILTELQI